MAQIDVIAVVQATLAPIFLVTGASLFLNVTQQRLFRVVDRVMKNEAVDEAQAWRDARRLLLLRNAVLLGFATIAITLLTILLLLVPSAFPGRRVGTWPIWTLGTALLAFGGALAFAFTDAVIAVKGARRVSRDRRAAQEEARRHA